MKKRETELQIEINQLENIDLVYITGTYRINSSNAYVFKDFLKQNLMISDKKLLIDMSEIQYIDSSGFGALMSALKISKEYGTSFKICNLSSQVIEIIKLMKLDTVLDIQSDIKTGISSYENDIV
ncbi:MAG: STAS domain-containing protein [Marinifilaceae bacterium]|jgi:anti-sigma B factor antagonist|nr:STAS domain-containing protein [Marinifilaceae bacterium]